MFFISSVLQIAFVSVIVCEYKTVYYFSKTKYVCSRKLWNREWMFPTTSSFVSCRPVLSALQISCGLYYNTAWQLVNPQRCWYSRYGSTDSLPPTRESCIQVCGDFWNMCPPFDSTKSLMPSLSAICFAFSLIMLLSIG